MNEGIEIIIYSIICIACIVIMKLLLNKRDRIRKTYNSDREIIKVKKMNNFWNTFIVIFCAIVLCISILLLFDTVLNIYV